MEYQQVPSIISGKDLDYLSDMFNWNYGAYKSALNGSKSVNDSDIKTMLEKCSNVFYQNLTGVLNILNRGGSNE